MVTGGGTTGVPALFDRLRLEKRPPVADSRTMGTPVVIAETTSSATSQRMERLGRLVSGIAHELNTPIQSIALNVRYVFDTFPQLTRLVAAADAAARPGATATDRDAYDAVRAECEAEGWLTDTASALEDALTGCDRLGALVKAMADFGARGSSDVRAVDLRAVLDGLLTLSRNEWKYHADLTMDVAEHLPHVMADEGLLRLRCLELILEAGRAVTAASSTRAGRQGWIALHAVPCDGQVEVRVWHDARSASTGDTRDARDTSRAPDGCLRLPLAG